MLSSFPAPAVLSALLEALEGAGLGCTLVIDRGDRVDRVYANAAVAKMFGVSREELLEVSPMARLAPGERERLETIRADLWARGETGPVVLETRLVRADGTTLPIEVGMGYATLEGARATFAFLRDVSAKAAMEGALRASEEGFRRLAESSPDAITVYAEGGYKYANPAALRHLGISSLSELATVNAMHRVQPEEREGLLERGRRVLAGEQLPPHEVRVTTAEHATETILEVSLSSTSIDGHPAIISYARDITERVRLHAELMKQDRLASVGMLAAGVAHELNSPLTSLGMQARRLRDNADRLRLPGEVRQALEQMDEAATRMNAIIADLLFMARPVDQPQAHVDLGEILRSTISLLRAGIARCPAIQVEVEQLPPIQGYASKLGQVILNVLRNAVQAVEAAPGGAIRVRGRVVGDRITIEISDNGPGIPREILGRVTQPFFTTKPDGTGLGLWISQELMAQHAGSLDLSSAEGKGTTVILSLPQKLGPAPAESPQRGREGGGSVE